MPSPIKFPSSQPMNLVLNPQPQPTDDLTRFGGYDAVLITYTDEEASCLAKLYTPLAPIKTWHPYRHDVEKYIALVTAKNAPFNTADSPSSLSFHTMCLYMPVTVGTKKVLLIKSGLHFAYDGPALALSSLAQEIVAAVKPKIVITTGTAGGIGLTTRLGDINIATAVRFRCTGQYSHLPFANASYPVSAIAPPHWH